MSDWQTIITSITTSIAENTLVLAGLVWLARSFIGSLLSKDLERYRANLTAENQTATERHRHELSLVAKKLNIIFSNFHQKRADAIAGIYERIVEVSRKGASYVSLMGYRGEPTKQEKYSDFVDPFNDLVGYFGKNRIYVPEETCAKIDELVDLMKSAVVEMNAHISQPDELLEKEGLIAKWEVWEKSWKCFENQVPVTKKALESDLRTLLGDSKPVAS